jgi:hypothetical protein
VIGRKGAIKKSEFDPTPIGDFSIVHVCEGAKDLANSTQAGLDNWQHLVVFPQFTSGLLTAYEALAQAAEGEPLSVSAGIRGKQIGQVVSWPVKPARPLWIKHLSIHDRLVAKRDKGVRIRLPKHGVGEDYESRIRGPYPPNGQGSWLGKIGLRRTVNHLPPVSQFDISEVSLVQHLGPYKFVILGSFLVGETYSEEEIGKPYGNA